jgi:hypothetical protein
MPHILTFKRHHFDAVIYSNLGQCVIQHIDLLGPFQSSNSYLLQSGFLTYKNF